MPSGLVHKVARRAVPSSPFGFKEAVDGGRVGLDCVCQGPLGDLIQHSQLTVNVETMKSIKREQSRHSREGFLELNSVLLSLPPDETGTNVGGQVRRSWALIPLSFDGVTVNPRVDARPASPGGQNCARGSRACVYLSLSTGAAADHARSIAWVDSIEIACQVWRESGDTPFPMLKVLSSLDWHGLDPRGLRYLYYIASLGNILDQNNARQFALWWDTYEVGIQATAKYDFVAYAQIVAAASRIGKLTRMASVMEDAVRYRSLALKGLQQALASFSRENADGVLAASISFMFNQPTPADLRRITQGTVAVVEAMRPWAASSGARPLLDHIYPVQQDARCPLTQHAEIPCSPEPTVSTPLVMVQSATAAIEFLLEQGLTALNRLAMCIKHMKELSTAARGLADMLRMAQAEHLNGQKHDPFWLVHPFSGLTSRESISFSDITSSKPFVLVFLAHLYSALVVVSMLYPELDAAGFVSIRLYSLDALTRHFEPMTAIDCETCREAHGCQELLAFPWNVLQANRKWQMDRPTVLPRTSNTSTR
ncbi:uncharacterized protein Z519_09324 [Cladophialophora bantiana CBS 173.52]|uniref:Uncharacterized protein n=1 Tax=Cladophialophora bantiana (strain ATCC 10958 / CBS 173.52 / CDC B-1940 / NIH 8579) TaxID=1442370 RepID=A0A0D2HGH0_CLAB1|nr:uncharacterized protein Z519_09324 [Cladophialophora bantiana CBS 173.52]KIW89895.1 hypothetical protein Z519_09324 [Cladophialophora bantiana CBS 173.52]